jgi:hypothetical protein
MTQIPIPITVEVSAAAATPEVASASLYPSLLASVDAMADPDLWVLMEAVVYSLRQRDTLTRSIKECGTIECFGDRWPQDFDFLPTQSEVIALAEAIIDQFSSRQLHACWRELLNTCNRTQKLALIEAITYAQQYSSTVLQALGECELLDLFGDSLEHLDVWLCEPEALRLIRLFSGSLLASSEVAPSPGDGRDDR